MRMRERAGEMAAVRAGLLAVVLGIAAVALAGCGTKVVSNEVLVSVDRSTDAVGPGPIDVAVFDSTMGSSSEYGARWLGTTTETEPYRADVRTTVTRLIGDGSPPERLDLGLVVPALAPRGYFAVSVTDQTAAAGGVAAPFVPDHAAAEAGDGPVAPLAVAITREAVGDAWRVTLLVRP
jgi:hypothetical protein